MRPGYGAPGASQGFITPPSTSSCSSQIPGRAIQAEQGEGNPLLFDLQVFLRSIKVFSSLTHKQAFVLPTFIPSAFLLPLGLEHQEVSVFLFTMEKDILPLSSVSVV